MSVQLGRGKDMKRHLFYSFLKSFVHHLLTPLEQRQYTKIYRREKTLKIDKKKMRSVCSGSHNLIADIMPRLSTVLRLCVA